jgi:peptidoglycan hydrolase-like protein with peptidoglycan-binding domain
VHGTEFIRWVQSTLNRVNAARLAVDGVMSAGTRSALRDFQRRKGLPMDGIAGPEVEQALRDARRDAGAVAGAGHPAPPPAAREVFEFETLEFESPLAMATLRRGASGSVVSELQRRLGAAGFSPGAVDGLFGSRTEGAVRAYQRARGLGLDGIVGPQTWAALLGTGTVLPPAPVSPGSDSAIEALNLAEAARSAAYTVKARHPWVRFTSGRRDVPGQASAMAGNVVLNRQWIEQTYADNAVSRAAQAWVDAHPEARSKEAIAAGLLGVLQGFSSAELGRLSYHLSGLAFDIQPVSGQLAAISSTINGLPRLKEFLTREGGLERWHVALT